MAQLCSIPSGTRRTVTVLAENFEFNCRNLSRLTSTVMTPEEIRSKLSILGRSYDNIECVGAREGWNCRSYVLDFRTLGPVPRIREFRSVLREYEVRIELSPSDRGKGEYRHLCTIATRGARPMHCMGTMRPMNDSSNIEPIDFAQGTGASPSIEAAIHCLLLIVRNWNQLPLFV